MKDKSKKVDLYMPLWIGDYLADTSRLTTIQHGAYLLLIMDYWRNGEIPDNDGILSQVCRMTRDEWSENKSVVMGFFDLKDGKYCHGRIDSELNMAKEKREALRLGGENGARKRWANGQANSHPNGQANGQANASQSYSQSYPKSYNQEEKKKQQHAKKKEEPNPDISKIINDEPTDSSCGLAFNLNIVLDELIEARYPAGTIKNISKFKATLIEAHKRNPSELGNWKAEIESSKQKKRERQAIAVKNKRMHEETAKSLEADIERKIEIIKRESEISKVMGEFNKLPEHQISAIRAKAEASLGPSIKMIKKSLLAKKMMDAEIVKIVGECHATA